VVRQVDSTMDCIERGEYSLLAEYACKVAARNPGLRLELGVTFGGQQMRDPEPYWRAWEHDAAAPSSAFAPARTPEFRQCCNSYVRPLTPPSQAPTRTAPSPSWTGQMVDPDLPLAALPPSSAHVQTCPVTNRTNDSDDRF
jgi:hypothetical protein